MKAMGFLLWQLIDSGFPAGGFAHSGGLEASMQHGQVVTGADVASFARHVLAQAGRSALPIVAAAGRDLNALPELDRLSDVFLSNPVANRASRAQGRAFLTTVSRSFPSLPLARLAEVVRAERLGCHYAPVFGAAMASLDVDPIETQRAFLFMTVRAVASAAVRLGLVGAYEAQELQARLSHSIDSVIHTCETLGPYDIAQTAPLIDLFQSTHDRLYSRLFQS
jgi:urease accessory protein